ncbi:hypothetical protein GDO81_009997 [Engystomops pustulosus]|uniref:Uncharacterized protein n=1 Tax=Engystomops pustulosus TaxID=76066 RepID=A0AAV7BWL2_ENGPU|nr:hypothetical protein GDO81_009997 [Engystomops pustulosus]
MSKTLIYIAYNFICDDPCYTKLLSCYTMLPLKNSIPFCPFSIHQCLLPPPYTEPLLLPPAIHHSLFCLPLFISPFYAKLTPLYRPPSQAVNVSPGLASSGV